MARSLFEIIGGLMLAENPGDVHDEIDALRDLTGVARLEGYHDHWTRDDWASIGDPFGEGD